MKKDKEEYTIKVRVAIMILPFDMKDDNDARLL